MGMINWTCITTWRRASVNTAWCLLGCAAGDLGTIAYFQLTETPFPVWGIMALAMVNGILASIALETAILARYQPLTQAFRTAVGMSLISMVAMEMAMNGVDLAIVGTARLTPSVIPLMLLAGFLAPLPYKYWRLRALGKACH